MKKKPGRCVFARNQKALAQTRAFIFDGEAITVKVVYFLYLAAIPGGNFSGFSSSNTGQKRCSNVKQWDF